MMRQMSESQALGYIADELLMVLDDDYPDRMESLIDELMDEGFSELEAEKLIYNY